MTMNTYRTSVDLDGDTYTYVEMGPVPGMPLWHHLSQPSRWPFPKEQAAFRFAETAKGSHPQRDVVVITPDRKRFVL
ncbi:hypothetical protein KIV63_gp18 [Mycobacterium phage SWU2]|uniref:Uncharacterized protein n=1 Tax=Mycobacterium phage SWU2 TaxID=2077150 RepID=A0A2K9VI43_9CAUD|nr:hypothetical protein KIV63_gp18 [Mycobacterium phage SWU2]AUV62026.1 hypothetical protein JX_gp67 [Mycobacterium phage SWU2]